MAYIEFLSENPKFSFVLGKNPESGMMINGIRLGYGFAWYNKEKFNLYFEDAPDEISYKTSKDQQFDYNSSTSMTANLAHLNLINAFLNHLIHNEHENDGVYFNRAKIASLEIQNVRGINLFQKYYPEFNLEVEELGKNTFSVTISGVSTFRSFMLYMYLFFMNNFLGNSSEWMPMLDKDVEKNIKILNYLDSPYFMKYLFKMKAVRSEKIFEKNKIELERNSRGLNINFEFGNTGDQRKRFIVDQLDFNKPVLDVGCGELRTYGQFIIKKLDNVPYYGVDVDEELIQENEKRSKSKEQRNVKFFTSIKDLKKQTKLDFFPQIIISEVIEHMQPEESVQFLKDVRNNFGFEKIVITTPDSRFNKFYEMENGFRHPDHKFEPDREQFTMLIDQVFQEDYNKDWIQFGDRVNGCTNTQAMVITNK